MGFAQHLAERVDTVLVQIIIKGLATVIVQHLGDVMAGQARVLSELCEGQITGSPGGSFLHMLFQYSKNLFA